MIYLNLHDIVLKGHSASTLKSDTVTLRHVTHFPVLSDCPLLLHRVLCQICGREIFCLEQKSHLSKCFGVHSPSRREVPAKGFFSLLFLFLKVYTKLLVSTEFLRISYSLIII